MKQFDFDHPDFLKHSPERQEFMKTSYGQPIGEDEFVRIAQSWPKRGGKSNKHRTPSSLRKQYRRLQKNFEFYEVGI